MSRTVKTVQDDKGNDIEVYSDFCSVCSEEMLFPKDEADRIEAMFPFIKEKFEKGVACLKCAVEKEKENPEFNFTEEEKERIKQTLMNNA